MYMQAACTQTAYQRSLPRNALKYLRKDSRTLALAMVYGTQFKAYNTVQEDSKPNPNTETRCQDKAGFSATRQRLSELLAQCAWPKEKAQALFQAFDQRYSLKQGSGS